ncbi:MAG: helix-turn-helix domain-containing protein [Candidatus Rokuibacteriota bacterium]
MDGWWDQIDEQVRMSLERNGAMTPSEISRQLSISESAVQSILSLLAQEGKVRIAKVEPAPRWGR